MSTPIFQSTAIATSASGNNATDVSLIFNPTNTVITSTTVTASITVGTDIIIPAKDSLQVYDTLTGLSKFHVTPCQADTVFYVNSRYFVSSYYGEFYTSVDLVTWTLVSTVHEAIIDIVYFNSKYYAVMSPNTVNSSKEAIYYTSTDGLTWTILTSPATYFNTITVFKAALYASTSLAIYKSTDGVTWTQVGTHTLYLNTRFVTDEVNIIGLFSTSGSMSTSYFTSLDGTTWTTRNASAPVAGAYFSNGLFFISMYTSTGSVGSAGSSTDLVTWTILPSSKDYSYYTSIGNTLYSITYGVDPYNYWSVSKSVAGAAFVYTDCLVFDFTGKGSATSIGRFNTNAYNNVIYSFAFPSTNVPPAAIMSMHDTVNKTFRRPIHAPQSHFTPSSIVNFVYIDATRVQVVFDKYVSGSGMVGTVALETLDNGLTYTYHYFSASGVSAANGAQLRALYYLSDTVVSVVSQGYYNYILQYNPDAYRNDIIYTYTNNSFNSCMKNDDVYYCPSNGVSLRSVRMPNKVYNWAKTDAFAVLGINANGNVSIQATDPNNGSPIVYYAELLDGSDTLVTTSSKPIYSISNGSAVANFASSSVQLFYSSSPSTSAISYLNSTIKGTIITTSDGTYTTEGFKIKTSNISVNAATTLTANGISVPAGKTFVGKLLITSLTQNAYVSFNGQYLALTQSATNAINTGYLTPLTIPVVLPEGKYQLSTSTTNAQIYVILTGFEV